MRKERKQHIEKTVEVMLDGKTYEIFRGGGIMYRPQSSHSRPNGKSSDIVLCPFCDAEVEIYRWSFWGCGKRCECGAKLEPMTAYKEVKK